MAEKEPVRRARPVRKSLTFSESEWERVKRRQAIAGSRSFTEFAREAVLEGEVRVTRVAFDAAALRVDLSRIGNNINQIARAVNVDGGTTYDEMRAARVLLGQIQDVITAALDAPAREE